ncbi:MAG: hypothetical protein WA347_00125 [Rhabdochlamydiaceae bacterium]
MPKNKKVNYSEAERFDADFKKRKSEINDEILNWSLSEPFQSKIRQQISLSLSDHDVLINLSKRLFENGGFTANFKELTKKEIESNAHKTWIERLSKWLWLVVGGIITVVGEFFIKKCF